MFDLVISLLRCDPECAAFVENRAELGRNVCRPGFEPVGALLEFHIRKIFAAMLMVGFPL